MTTMAEDPDVAVRQRDALGERLFGSLLNGMELLTVGLGVRTGLYAALRDGGPATGGQLAGRAGVAERYVQEWLEQQATAGIVQVATAGDPATRSYRLPDGDVEALLEPDSSGYVAAAVPGLVGLAKALEVVASAYRTGEGVGFARYGAEIRDHIGGFNRPMFVNELVSEWLPALADVHQRLQSGAPVRVLDVACGIGWSSIALAKAYPNVRVDGIDLEEASIIEARRHAAETGVNDRVRFTVGDERVAASFTAPGDEVERFMYVWSVLHCLPATLAESPKVANGTVLRTDTVRAWAREAGFAQLEVLPIDNDFWRFYRPDT